MTTVKLKNVTIGLYESIKDLPIRVSRMMQLYSMQEGGIGNSVGKVDEKLAKAIAHLQNDHKDDAITELKNLRLTVFSALEQIDHKSKIFGCMVATENGKRITDYSEHAIEERLKRYEAAGLTFGMVDDVLDTVKKNLMQNV